MSWVFGRKCRNGSGTYYQPKVTQLNFMDQCYLGILRVWVVDEGTLLMSHYHRVAHKHVRSRWVLDVEDRISCYFSLISTRAGPTHGYRVLGLDDKNVVLTFLHSNSFIFADYKRLCLSVTSCPVTWILQLQCSQSILLFAPILLEPKEDNAMSDLCVCLSVRTFIPLS